ncbi:MAG: hypothetical protein ACLUOI_11910 [Eisenbergiella sp.]
MNPYAFFFTRDHTFGTENLTVFLSICQLLQHRLQFIAANGGYVLSAPACKYFIGMMMAVIMSVIMSVIMVMIVTAAGTAFIMVVMMMVVVMCVIVVMRVAAAFLAVVMAVVMIMLMFMAAAVTLTVMSAFMMMLGGRDHGSRILLH